MDEVIKVGFLFDKDNDWIRHEIGDFEWLPKFSLHYQYIESYNVCEVTGIDVLFILGYMKILSAEALASNGLNLVVHESALPNGRGFSPMQWQLLDGAKEIQVCLIEAASPVDSGEIIGSTTILLKGHELLPELRIAQANATKELIISFLNKYPNYSKIAQTGKATYFPKRSRDDDRLDINKTIKQQFNQLRIADNVRYPAYFEINGVKYFLRIDKVCLDE